MARRGREHVEVIMLIDIGLVVVVLLAIWGFVSIVGSNTRWLSRRTDRTAESMYGRTRTQLVVAGSACMAASGADCPLVLRVGWGPGSCVPRCRSALATPCDQA